VDHGLTGLAPSAQSGLAASVAVAFRGCAVDVGAAEGVMRPYVFKARPKFCLAYRPAVIWVACQKCGHPHEEYFGPPDRDARAAESAYRQRARDRLRPSRWTIFGSVRSDTIAGVSLGTRRNAFTQARNSCGERTRAISAASSSEGERKSSPPGSHLSGASVSFPK